MKSEVVRFGHDQISSYNDSVVKKYLQRHEYPSAIWEQKYFSNILKNGGGGTVVESEVVGLAPGYIFV
jgi:hypothetical protein